MKKSISALAMAAVALCGAAVPLAMPAGAADITVSDGPSSSAPAATSPAPNSLTAIGGGVPNTGGVAPSVAPTATSTPSQGSSAIRTGADMAAMAIATNNAELAAIAGLSPTSKVHVIVVAADDSDAAALAKARSDMQADVAKLQAAIAANASFKSDLQGKSIDVGKVIAAEVASDGSLTLYAMK